MIHDLHIHSKISDGKLTKEEIIKLAKEQKMEVISFTDHNNYSDIIADIPVIKGIEFDAVETYSFHLLVYFHEYSQEIKNLVDKYRENITQTSVLLLEKIKEIHKIEIPIKSFSYPITKRDIIDYLINNSYACSVNEANLKYTGKKADSYIQKYSLDFKDIMKLDKENVTTVLAHPVSLNMNDDQLFSYLKYLQELKLDGIEVVNTSKISLIQTIKYLEMAKKLNLLTSSGSDFHDLKKNTIGVDDVYSDTLIKKYIK